MRKISLSPIIKLEKKGGNFAFENHMPLNVVNVKWLQRKANLANYCIFVITEMYIKKNIK